MARVVQFFLVLFYYLGLAIFFTEFVLTGILDANLWFVLYPSTLMMLAFFVCGWSEIKETTCDALGWGLVLLLAAVSAFLKLQQGGTEEVATPFSNPLLGIGLFYCVLSVWAAISLGSGRLGAKTAA